MSAAEEAGGAGHDACACHWQARGVLLAVPTNAPCSSVASAVTKVLKSSSCKFCCRGAWCLRSRCCPPRAFLIPSPRPCAVQTFPATRCAHMASRSRGGAAQQPGTTPGSLGAWAGHWDGALAAGHGPHAAPDGGQLPPGRPGGVAKVAVAGGAAVLQAVDWTFACASSKQWQQAMAAAAAAAYPPFA